MRNPTVAMSRRSRDGAAFEPGRVEDAAREFLDGAAGRVDERDVESVEQALRLADLEPHLAGRGVAAADPARAAQIPQTPGLDREPVDLVPVLGQDGRDPPLLQVAAR